MAKASIPTANSTDDHLICTPRDDISAPTVTRDDLQEYTSKFVTIDIGRKRNPHPSIQKVRSQQIQADADHTADSKNTPISAKLTLLGEG